MSKFDYVIVGAGSAGCAVAARLSLDPSVSVLVVEAGGGDRNPAIAVPKGLAFLMDNPKYGWHYDTEPFGPFGQTEHWVRGKVIGGSSSINGMVYNRGSQADYDDLVAKGNPAWGWEEMLRVYRTIEDHSLGGSEMRGAGGPLKISINERPEEVSEALMDSAAALGIRRVEDVNASDEERTGYAPATISGGLRMSAAKAFLKPALRRPNVSIALNTLATKLIFDGDRVIGVSATNADGHQLELRASREVILSMGSLGTPQLLQMSGIGPRSVLKEAGVEVRVDSSRVGEGLREHRCFPLQMRLRENKGYNKLLATPGRQALTGMKYLLTRKGPIATPAYDMLTFLKSRPDSPRPDAQVLMTPFSLGLGLSKAGLETRPGLSLLGFALRPTSEGSVRITSNDPSRAPRVEVSYLETAHDREVSIGMFRRMRDVVQQSPIADMLHSEIEPGRALDTDEGILRSGFLNGGSGYHASGACAMGPSGEDPLDGRLRVRGVSGLRVVDVSILPAMVAGNLNGPIMAMAWRAAELILEDR